MCYTYNMSSLFNRNADLKERAISLRKSGLSYSEILETIPVAKSTLALWLGSVGLSKKQKKRITQKKLAAARRGGEIRRFQRVAKTKKIKVGAKLEVMRLITDPLWLSGTMLYWAEGSKEKEWRTGAKLAFTNMDPDALGIFSKWVKKFLHVPGEEFRYELFIHKNSDLNRALTYWSEKLFLQPEQLRVYFKKHNLKSRRKNRANKYFGVVKINILKSVDLNRKVAGWIEGVVQYLGKFGG